MDKAERKRLKQEGKRLVEEKSRAVREALERANPVPLSDPRWAENYKKQTLRERELRAGPPNRIAKSVADANWQKIVVEEDFQPGPPRAATQYLECPDCGDLIHIQTTETITCACGLIGLDVERRAFCAPTDRKIPLVKLIGSASSARRA